MHTRLEGAIRDAGSLPRTMRPPGVPGKAARLDTVAPAAGGARAIAGAAGPWLAIPQRRGELLTRV
jgi:hypothetical protein